MGEENTYLNTDDDDISIFVQHIDARKPLRRRLKEREKREREREVERREGDIGKKRGMIIIEKGYERHRKAERGNGSTFKKGLSPSLSTLGLFLSALAGTEQMAAASSMAHAVPTSGSTAATTIPETTNTTITIAINQLQPNLYFTKSWTHAYEPR
ncbi:hypothetical protein BYT27DRAFT_7262478 [Phlegmacium glaucopus]|nr:hypothetical protein BYT27DRAFT_7262478 [Phlegmacium glaucopus]